MNAYLMPGNVLGAGHRADMSLPLGSLIFIYELSNNIIDQRSVGSTYKKACGICDGARGCFWKDP